MFMLCFVLYFLIMIYFKSRLLYRFVLRENSKNKYYNLFIHEKHRYGSFSHMSLPRISFFNDSLCVICLYNVALSCVKIRKINITIYSSMKKTAMALSLSHISLFRTSFSNRGLYIVPLWCNPAWEFLRLCTCSFVAFRACVCVRICWVCVRVCLLCVRVCARKRSVGRSTRITLLHVQSRSVP